MTTTFGTKGRDTITALSRDDTVRAMAGDDTVYAGSDRGGQRVDVVYLGKGNDRAEGFRYDDTVYGGPGRDTIMTGRFQFDGGNILFDGGPDDDVLRSEYPGVLLGGEGNDYLYVSRNGYATLSGGPGNDRYGISVQVPYDLDIIDREGSSEIQIYEKAYFTGMIITGDWADRITVHNEDYGGRFAVHTIHSGGGNDRVWSGSDVSVIYAGPGNDTVHGGTVYGGRGNDELSGVTVNGGLGDDSLLARDTARGGRGDDTLNADKAYGGLGNDRITADKAYGGEGDDVVRWADVAYGGPGDDSLDGARMYGGTGDDTLSGFRYYEDYMMFGGQGNDELHVYVGAGHDVLTGGSGADRFAIIAVDFSSGPRSYTPRSTITDFTFGEDAIDLSDLVRIRSLDDLILTEDSGNVIIQSLDRFGLFIVENARVSDFSSDDFIFS